MSLNNRMNNLPSTLKTSLKVMGYASAMALVGVGITYAHLDQQVENVSSLVFGKVANLVVGTAALFGGGHALIQGNVSRGMAILGTGVVTGIGIALAKNGQMFDLFAKAN